jgi:pimeloyl-ACP methyl ester carboxylesterase
MNPALEMEQHHGLNTLMTSGSGGFMRIAAKWRVGSWSSVPFVEDAFGSLNPRHPGVDVIRLGRGDPIVLVPGLAGGRELLGPLARRLARRNEVILPSLRGDRGLLGTAPARDVAAHAEELGRTLDGLGLERPIVLGVSFGGAVALEYAVEHPHRIGGLAIWGAEARFRPTLGTNIARHVCERYPLPADSPFLNQFFNLLHGRKPEPGPLTDFIIEACWTTDQSVVAHRLAMLHDFDVADRLWRIDAPTLVLAGSRDVVVPPSRQRALAESIAGAGFTQVEGAGHVGFLTHRAEVAEGLAGLVRKVRRTYC